MNLGQPVLVSVIDADELDASGAERIAKEFCKVFLKSKRKGSHVFINCLYIFFDEGHCADQSAGILRKGQKDRRISTWENTYVYVWPVVVNVQAKKLEYRKRFLDGVNAMALRPLSLKGMWVVNKSALYETLVT